MRPEQFDRIKDKINKQLKQGLDQSDAIQIANETELPPDKDELNLSPPPPEAC